MENWEEILRKREDSDDLEKSRSRIDIPKRMEALKYNVFIPTYLVELNAQDNLNSIRNDVWGKGIVEKIDEKVTHQSEQVTYGNRVNTDTIRRMESYDVYTYGYRLVASSNGATHSIEIKGSLPVLGVDQHPKALRKILVKSYYRNVANSAPTVITEGSLQRKPSGRLMQYDGFDYLGNRLTSSVVMFEEDELKYLLALDCKNRTERGLMP